MTGNLTELLETIECGLFDVQPLTGIEITKVLEAYLEYVIELN